MTTAKEYLAKRREKAQRMNKYADIKPSAQTHTSGQRRKRREAERADAHVEVAAEAAEQDKGGQQ
jgi:hypothetical protein